MSEYCIRWGVFSFFLFGSGRRCGGCFFKENYLDGVYARVGLIKGDSRDSLSIPSL